MMNSIISTIYDFDELSDVYLLVKLKLCNTFRYEIKGPKTILSHREDLVVGNTIVVKCDDIIREAIIVHISNEIMYLLNLKKKLTEQFRKEQENVKSSTKENGKSRMSIVNASRKLYEKYTKRCNSEKDNSILPNKDDVLLKKKNTKIFSKISLKQKKQREIEDPFNLYSIKMQNGVQGVERVPDITHEGPTYNSLLSTRKKFSDVEDCVVISSDEDDENDVSNNLFGSKNIFTRTSLSGSEDGKLGKRTGGNLRNVYGQKKIKQI